MKRFKYSNGMKAVMLILQTLFVVLMTISIVIIIIFFRKRVDFTNMIEGKAYVESEMYSKALTEEIHALESHIDERRNFETAGVYNPNKIVDIGEFANRGIISDSVYESVGYYLEDLVKWSQEGFSNTEIYVSADGAGEMPGNTAEILSENAAGEVPVTEAQSSYAILGIEEKYLTVNEVTIFEQARNVNELEQWYQYLNKTLSVIGDEVMRYKQRVNYYLIENTNLRYLFFDKTTKELYTNIELQDAETEAAVLEQNVKTKDAALQKNMEIKENNYLFEEERIPLFLEEFMKEQPLFYMDSEETKYTNSLKLEEDMISYLMRTFSNKMKGDYIIGLSVNTDFLADDVLYQSKMEYEGMQPWCRIVIIGVLSSAVLAFALFVYLTLAAGHKPEDDRIYLNWFDFIKTELAAGFMGLLAAGLILGGYIIIQTLFDSRNYLQVDFLWVILWFGGWAVVANIIFLCGYMSLVRRLKAGTFWNNTIVYALGKLFLKFFHNRKEATKLFALYFTYLVINLLLVLLGNRGILIAFLFDLGVGWKLFLEVSERKAIKEGVKNITDGNLEYKINTEELHGDNRMLAGAINHIGEGLHSAVDASLRNERLKTDLITNVSHDIKTPLTSIINYVDLLKRENIEDEKIKGYIYILDNKSQRLKHLTEDLVEASKISSGNIKLNIEPIDFVELINQTTGEFAEKFEARGLNLVLDIPKEPVVIMADGRRIWRIIENLYNNVAKYAMPDTRVYADLFTADETAVFSLKNISENQLNINADELTERFIRGDISRSTEGSGLGLSIARNLTELQNGKFEIYLDGDLFKVTIQFEIKREVTV